MDLNFHVTFEHKSKGHGTSASYASIKEVKEAIFLMSREYNCTCIEIMIDVTELIKD